MRSPRKNRLGESGSDAANEIKGQIRERSKPVFHVSTENPEEQHVPDNVKKSAVKKHARNQRQKCLEESVVTSFQREVHFPGHQGVRVYECFQSLLRK